MNKQPIKDSNVSGKKVLVRVDFNVNLDEKTGGITDDSRIRAALPTINYLIENRARIILCSHLGRPDGKVVENLRLKVVGERLSELIEKPVITTTDCIGLEAEIEADGLEDGELLLLENLRFHSEEEGNGPDFAAALAKLADVYVNDAFGTCHRDNASMLTVPRLMEGRPRVVGYLVQRELEFLGRAISNPVRPLVCVLGGAKVSDKLGVLEALAPHADVLAVLAAWGNAGGPEDLDGSGTVDFGDILVVLAAWGPCT